MSGPDSERVSEVERLPGATTHRVEAWVAEHLVRATTASLRCEMLLERGAIGAARLEYRAMRSAIDTAERFRGKLEGAASEDAHMSLDRIRAREKRLGQAIAAAQWMSCFATSTASPSHGAGSPDDGERISPRPHRGIVIVVDDDEDLLQSMEDVLEHDGYLVLRARNGREALARMRGLTGPVVAVIDLMMPDMDGWELARLMKGDANLANIPIIVCTGQGSDFVEGTTRVLHKPLPRHVLLDAVRESFAAV